MKAKFNRKASLVPQRRFSEEIKMKVVKDIESGSASVRQASQELMASEQTIYRWIYKYSRYLKKNRVMVIEDKSEAYRTKELEKRLKEAEAALGRKQMEIDFLNKLIEFANEEYKTDIKKNLSKEPSPGSRSTKGKGTSTK
ncbi:MAG TPA: transposase [Saprospiraceae bacterium]|nr:transposase [Saprospiraceae bacterium]